MLLRNVFRVFAFRTCVCTLKLYAPFFLAKVLTRSCLAAASYLMRGSEKLSLLIEHVEPFRADHSELLVLVV